MSLRTTCLTASRIIKNQQLHKKSYNSIITQRFKSIASDNTSSSFNTASSSTSKVSQPPSISSSTASSSSSSKNESQSVPLVQTALAALAGITTVAVAASIVESSTASTVPAFDPNGQRFDQSTFFGRFCRMFLECDPRLLTYTEEETKRSKQMVLQYKSLLDNLPDNMTTQQMNHALWEAQRISSSSLHPDTGDSIPQPFRMSGYVPYNGPVCVAMVASTSTPSLLFWSWVNQSQNALVNYYNRNASSEMDNATLLKSYSAAVTSALTVAFGLATFVQR